MSSINPEMLKQLLSEFEEKQAVCVEEINAITEQITELEKRITDSKERLSSVARDKEKIVLMKQRYAEGDWSSVLASLPKNGSAQLSTGEGSRTGDYPPVSAQATIENPAAFTVPSQAEAAPQAAAQAPAPVLEPARAPVVEPTPQASVAQVAPEPAPAMQAPEAQPAPQEAPAQPAYQMEAPTWDTPQPFAETPPQPAQAAAPAPPASEGLFPFSTQAQAESSEGADIPWAPPPSMSWESVGNHAFPNQGQPAATDPSQGFQQAPPQQAMPSAPFADPNMFGQQQPQAPFGQPQMDLSQAPPAGFGDPSQMQQQGAPPTGFMSPPPGPPPQGNQQSVLSSAFDEEFDISDALRGEDETGGNQDSRDNDKKIKDALRGLFS